MSGDVARVLSKDPVDFTPEDESVYRSLVCPSREFLKRTLRAILDADSGSREEWQLNLLRDRSSVICAIVGEVLMEGQTDQGKGRVLPRGGRAGEGDDCGPPGGTGAPDQDGAQEHSGPEGGKTPGPNWERKTEDAPDPAHGDRFYPGESGPLTSGAAPKGEGVGLKESDFLDRTLHGNPSASLSHKMESGAGREKSAMTAGTRSPAPLRWILKSLGWLLVIITCVLVLAAAFLFVSPRFGLQAHPVLSGSMEPALKVGGLVICRKIPVEEVKVGDIIGFVNQNGVKTVHRVIEISENDGKIWFRTKGDANEDPDPETFSIPEGKVDKVVFHIPYAGYLSGFLRSRTGFLLFIACPGAILILMFALDIWKAVAELREERKKGEGSGDKDTAKR